MKFFILFLICIGSMQGCSTNKTLMDEKIQQSVIDEFKNDRNQAGQTVEFGGTGDAGHAECFAKSMQLLGMPCKC